MCYLSYEMSKQFGWNIYKKIGADVRIQSKFLKPYTRHKNLIVPMICVEMYRIFQFFALSIKVDIFTEFLVSFFYLIQFALNDGKSNWDTWVQLVVTVLLLPMLYFARTAVRLLTLLLYAYIKLIFFSSFFV